jgi:xanthine dehydrogenase accessory factor
MRGGEHHDHMAERIRRMQEDSVPAVLVTVAQIQARPARAGARMLYTAGDQFDTIGGGHLEWRGADRARHAAGRLRRAGDRRRLERIALGPSLGQCCGGVVFLCFERIDAESAALPPGRHWSSLVQR